MSCHVQESPYSVRRLYPPRSPIRQNDVPESPARTKRASNSQWRPGSAGHPKLFPTGDRPGDPRSLWPHAGKKKKRQDVDWPLSHKTGWGGKTSAGRGSRRRLELRAPVGKSGSPPQCERCTWWPTPPLANPHAPQPHSASRVNFLAIVRTRIGSYEDLSRTGAKAFSYIHKCRPPSSCFPSPFFLSSLITHEGFQFRALKLALKISCGGDSEACLLPLGPFISF